MGSLFSYFKSPPRPTRKRKRSPDADDVASSIVVKRIRSTYEHVYQELFCKGEGSDVTINALGQDWRLHRMYLKQSPFFAAMFNGGWKESCDGRIVLDLLDENITPEALRVIFGSFYTDRVSLSDKNIIGVLAAATWFQMDEIRRLCAKFLRRRVKLHTLLCLHTISTKYNLPELNEACVDWLVKRLTLLPDCPVVFDLIKKIPISLMQTVISCPRLIVVQFEEDVFTCLLKWLYLQQKPEIPYRPGPQLLVDAYRYFAKDAPGFLDSDKGSSYVAVFRAIRWEHVISHFRSTCQLVRDGIIPRCWLQKAYQRQWIQQLRCHDLQLTTQTPVPTPRSSPPIRTPQHSSLLTAARGEATATTNGPRERSVPGPNSTMPAELFWRHCERLGRRINNGEVACTWRWSGYHFGVDLLFKYRNRVFYVVRPTDAAHSEGVVCTSRKHIVKVVLTVISTADEDYSPSSDPSACGVTANLFSSSPSSSFSSPSAETPGVGEPSEGSEDEDGGVQNSPVSSHWDSGKEDDRQSKHTQICTSELKTLRMVENIPYELLRLPTDFEFPVVVSANILRYDPWQ